jgi:hypothetical protein
MKKRFLPLFLPGLILTIQAQAVSAPPDYSGIYKCTGSDAHEGKYEATATLERIPEQSEAQYVAYRFRLEVPGYGVYPGHAAAKDREMAIYFALIDQSTRDFGTGIASFTKMKNGKWAFRKFYYEPEFKDGNHGTEDCMQQ